MRTDKKNKKLIIKRFKTIEGHLKKITQMVEDGRYCIEILQQTTAVKNAIKSAEAVLLDNHLHSCVIRDIKKGRQKAVDELLVLFKKT
ncbi:MAG: metal-sensitive transcriptional regulator [bacterium]|nr:metal-sensitive transcriptional regulator [bacterium]